jgi:hypothetical protein
MSRVTLIFTKEALLLPLPSKQMLSKKHPPKSNKTLIQTKYNGRQSVKFKKTVIRRKMYNVEQIILQLIFQILSSARKTTEKNKSSKAFLQKKCRYQPKSNRALKNIEYMSRSRSGVIICERAGRRLLSCNKGGWSRRVSTAWSSS